MRKSVKRAVVVGTTLAVTAGAGAAYAAWLASGAGTGAAKAATAQALTTGEVTVAGVLYPGASAALQIKINNPNAYPVQVKNIVVKSAGITSSATGCTSASLVVTGAANGEAAYPVTEPVAAGGSTTVTLAGAVKMVADAENECQGATFSVPVSFTGVSAAS